MATVCPAFTVKLIVVQALRRIAEAEGHVAELDFALDVLDLGQAGRLFTVADGIFQRVEVFQLGARFENLVGEAAQLLQASQSARWRRR